MDGAARALDSLRPGRFETNRLGWALALSLLIHLAGWGGYELHKQLNLSPWLHLLAKKVALKPKPSQDLPLEFVSVPNPSPEPPPDTKYYSSKNSRAANPDPKQAEKPQIDGKQTDIVKTEDVTRPNFNQLQPTPKQEQAEPTPPTPKPAEPAPIVEPGDLTLGKAAQAQQPQQQQRPRTIAQALAQSGQKMPGPKMRQDGGSPRAALVPSLDVKASPFGDYDEKLIEAVTQRWYDLLDSQRFALDRSGKVMLRFHLNYDGTITDMTVLQNNVGELLGHVCQNAINDPAPFAKWSDEMRRLVGQNYREITFTFYYY
jgi:hypothetical protein